MTDCWQCLYPRFKEVEGIGKSRMADRQERRYTDSQGSGICCQISFKSQDCRDFLSVVHWCSCLFYPFETKIGTLPPGGTREGRKRRLRSFTAAKVTTSWRELNRGGPSEWERPTGEGSVPCLVSPDCAKAKARRFLTRTRNNNLTWTRATWKRNGETHFDQFPGSTIVL